MGKVKGDRPEVLITWTELCEVVDQVRIRLNRDLIESAGLTLAENLALCQVAMSPKRRLRMVDLASNLVIAKSAVTKTVDRLEERGLLRRERDPGDRRTVYAALTSDGEKIFDLAKVAYLESVQHHFASRLDKSTLRQLRLLPEQVLGLGARSDDQRPSDSR
ncbi:MAG: MarR family transcriptional regulator [Actinomycetota bacterium]|nr:MAG: MarR family transcriptional regulator [Actinomycetota bacterium]